MADTISDAISNLNRKFFYGGFENLDYSVIMSKRTTQPFVKIYYTTPKKFFFNISSKRPKNIVSELKHSLIHVVIIMYRKKGLERDEIYAEHGKLFKCLYEKFYKEDFLDYDHDYRCTENLYQPGLYLNWKESCYLDSLLAVIFFSTNKPIFEEIMTKDIGDIETRHISLRKALAKDYNSLTSHNITKKCFDIRKEIVKVIPHEYTSFSVSEVYNALADVFSGLKIQLPRIPAGGLLQNATIYGNKNRITYGSLPLVPLWDFMDTSTYEKGEGSIIQWDMFDGDFIVFQNTLAPALRKYNDITEEIIIDEYQSEVTGKSVYNIHKKGRVFGEYILDGKYRLSAVVMQLGKRPSYMVKRDFDGHYVAYIRSKFVKEGVHWFYYDDLSGGEWDYIGESLPSLVFQDSTNSRPELLFYEKVKSPKIFSSKSLVISQKITRNTWRGNKFDVITIEKDSETTIITNTKLALKVTEKPVIVEGKPNRYGWIVENKEATAILEELKKLDKD